MGIPGKIGREVESNPWIKTTAQGVNLCTAARSGADFMFKTFSAIDFDEPNLKILTVRHPFYRFYSVWNSLFQEGNEQGRGLLRGYANFVPHKRYTQSNHIRMIISLKTFADEFLDQSVTWMDAVPGLKPQVEACNVCDTEWDYIVKLESWADDLEFISGHTMPDNLDPTNHVENGIGGETDGNRLVDDYAQLDLEVLLGLAKIYHYDMIYFH